MEKMNGFWTKEISLVLLLFEEKKRKNVLICRLNRKKHITYSLEKIFAFTNSYLKRF